MLNLIWCKLSEMSDTYSETRIVIKKHQAFIHFLHYYKKWHQLRMNQIPSHNKLTIIKPIPVSWCRLIRLEIGHIRLIHSHLISQLFPLTCDFCNTDNPLTITLLFSCPYLATTRNAHQVPNNLVQALANDPSQRNKPSPSFKPSNSSTKFR